MIPRPLHSSSDIFVCHLAVKASGRLHVTAFEGRGYHEWNLKKVANRCAPVIDDQQALVIEIAERIRGILSIEPLPLEHDRCIMRSLQTPVLSHLVEAGNVVVTWTSLTSEF